MPIRLQRLAWHACQHEILDDKMSTEAHGQENPRNVDESDGKNQTFERSQNGPKSDSVFDETTPRLGTFLLALFQLLHKKKVAYI